MKARTIVFILFFIFLSTALAAAENSPYFGQIIATPDKTLNFNLYLFHLKYQWVESADGNYSTISMVIQNDKGAKPLKWEDYKIYILLKDDTLFHNYTTVAKTGNYACKYTVPPGGQQVQVLCFGKKFKPGDIDKVWAQMTHSNFIKLLYYTGTKEKTTSTATSTAASGSGGGGGSMGAARALLQKFLDPNSDHSALTRRLRPTSDDYQSYFVDSSWQKAMEQYNDLWDNYPMAIKPDEGQTELLLWKATRQDIKNGSGDAGEFPGGYKSIIDQIKDGHTIYRFKFVEPGKELGMAFDGLVFINGHWVLIPKPWRVLR